ncbi:hypothetical protein ORI98_02305 [Shewanella sp. ULN5]|uniref:coiled-coil domain-containing protein n=1 Tax=Shewanella sp. ULN5 TaxID=2994678 RepID=UPI00273F1CC0|nr:hypothetical protein [Shewanella sp. ULN5]MDP5145272.1 hypothetical protein [Shewanella sp. ULN5]
MRKIRVFYSFLNYRLNENGRKKGKSSLIHSLRLSYPSMSGLKYLGKMSKLMRTRNELAVEWDAALSGANLIDTAEGIVPLDSFSQEQRVQILFDVLGGDTKKGDLYAEIKSKSLYKIKKWIEAENASGQFAVLMKTYIESKKIIDINEAKDSLNLIDIQRKNQKIEQIMKYINAHNALVNKPKTLNSTNFEEILFKIPIKHGVGTDIISHTEMMSTMKAFLHTFYPAYPIKLMVLHDDERLPDENTGGHVHAFISGQNSLTGEYDLRLSQIKRVNEFLIKRGDAGECLDETGCLDYLDASAVTSYMQQMFYEFINEKLFNKKNLVVEFSPASERNSELRKQMSEEARLPKHQRPYNFQTRKMEVLQQQVALLDEEYQSITYNISSGEQMLEKLHLENSQLQKKKDELQQKTSQLQIDCSELLEKRNNIKEIIEHAQQFIHEQANVRDQLDVEINNKHDVINQLTQAVDAKHHQVSALEDEISEKSELLVRLKALTSSTLKPIEQMISKIFMRFKMAKEPSGKRFLNMVIEAFNNNLSPVFREISIDIAKLTQDSELQSALNKKNQKLSKNEPESGL